MVKGSACFRFKHVVTGEEYELNTSDKNLKIVETIPGWIHDITNSGDDDLIAMIWANEVFDSERPDTFANHYKVYDFMKKLKVMTIVGTRPEIIRLSRTIPKLDEHCDHILVTLVRTMIMNSMKFFL